MNKSEHNSGTKSKSKLRSWRSYLLRDRIEWSYVFGQDYAWREEVIAKLAKKLREKQVKCFTACVCGTVGTPINMALAVFACTLPNIKRIYICDNPQERKRQQNYSKAEKVPIFPCNTQNLIPYEVLRILGKEKVVFVSYKDVNKFILFQEDDLRRHKVCPNTPISYLAELREQYPDNAKYHYQEKWLSEDEVVLE